MSRREKERTCGVVSSSHTRCSVLWPSPHSSPRVSFVKCTVGSCLSVSLSLSLSHTHTHISLSLSHTHTHTSLSLSLTHTHTHTHTHTQSPPKCGFPGQILVCSQQSMFDSCTRRCEPIVSNFTFWCRMLQQHHRHHHRSPDSVSLGSGHLERSSADGVLNGDRSSYRGSRRGRYVPSVSRKRRKVLKEPQKGNAGHAPLRLRLLTFAVVCKAPVPSCRHKKVLISEGVWCCTSQLVASAKSFASRCSHHGTYARRDSVESPQRSLESPRPQRTLAMDLHTHRGSLDNVPTRILYKHDGYSQDDLIGYARETSPRGGSGPGYQDVSQITAVQVTPRPKPRAFPRTNPAYVGVHRRDGVPSYKKINIETSAPPTAIYNQRFYEAHAHPPPHPSFDIGMQTSTASIQAGHGDHDVSGRHLLYGRHDRSDSDTSHSSYGRIPSEMTDSLVSQSSGQIKGGGGSLGGGGGGGSSSHRDHSHSDSHSSQGSLRNIPDSHSSQGSLRSGHERDHMHEVSSSSHSSPRHQFNNNLENNTAHVTVDNKNIKGRVNKSKQKQQQQQQEQAHALARHNSEPDYANLPIVAHVKDGKIFTLGGNPSNSVKDHQMDVQQPGQLQQDRLSSSRSTGDSGKGRSSEMLGGIGVGVGGEDGLSPQQEFGRQDTPSSIRSHSTQNSTSHTSEGEWS